MPMTDEQIMKADAKSAPDVYAVTAMYLAIGALRTLPADNSGVGLIIRQLEVAIEKLRNKAT